ncbi:MAG: hypothetical protein PHF00_05085 [Elusimicrobia bacterium]|nr:hypothetical protein [Elusimicrobiota bacterium]
MSAKDKLLVIRDLARLAVAHKRLCLIPFILALIFGIFLIIVWDSPALMPFFYAVF